MSRQNEMNVLGKLAGMKQDYEIPYTKKEFAHSFTTMYFPERSQVKPIENNLENAILLSLQQRDFFSPSNISNIKNNNNTNSPR